MPALIEYLRGRDALIVLDNCEHLLGASAEIAVRVLAGCDRIRILATSREPLDVPGETVQRLSPSGTGSRPRRCCSARRVRGGGTLLARAEAAGGGPSISAADAATPVAENCRHLDGLPLAIELAAASTAGMPVEAILRALDEHLGVLDRATGTTRHRSLNATLHWSHSLLTQDQQAMLARLSVFSGGFTLQAAAAIVIDGRQQSVVPDLGRLVDKSLVVREDISDHDVRYHLLETVRQFAGERLEERNEVESTRRRHATYYASLSQDAGLHIMGRRRGGIASVARSARSRSRQPHLRDPMVYRQRSHRNSALGSSAVRGFRGSFGAACPKARKRSIARWPRTHFPTVSTANCNSLQRASPKPSADLSVHPYLPSSWSRPARPMATTASSRWPSGHSGAASGQRVSTTRLKWRSSVAPNGPSTLATHSMPQPRWHNSVGS